MFENLATIIYVIIISCIAGSTTYFIEFLIGNPNEDKVNLRSIFSWIGVLIDEGYHRTETKVSDYMNERGGSNLLSTTQKLRVTFMLNWYKALGACHLCLNVYVTVIVTLLVYHFTDVSMWWVLLSLPVSSMFLQWLYQRF